MDSNDRIDLLRSKPDDIDLTTFSQILEMDEPGDQEFSSSIVFDFFDQAEQTFSDLEEALEKKDLPQLASLGHFLKGSSATLGLTKVSEGFARIERYGKREGLESDSEDSEYLRSIEELLPNVRQDFNIVEGILRDYYEGSGE